jgi:Ethylbenzene dehydrogenase
MANYSDNFVVDADASGGVRLIAPRRLPLDLAVTKAAMGEIDLDPNHGESDGARWFMTEAESVPYSPELDARIPAGTVIPGVIIAGEFSGDRADVRCAARWASGHWALEVARRLDTGSEYDVPIKTGIFMRVAAFDHSQIRHTRHVRPIRLEVE